MKKIFKTDISKYNLNDPYEKYLFKIAVSRDMWDYFQKIVMKTSSDSIQTAKKLVKKSKKNPRP